MRSYLYILVMMCFCSLSHAQDSTSISTRYFEDQIYVGLGYDFVLSENEAFFQRNLSFALQLGVIKDIPVNKARNLGFGVGLGYGLDNFYSNVSVDESTGVFFFDDDPSYRRGKIGLHEIQVPLEFRLRTSNEEKYNFLRLYTGVRFNYVFSARSKYVYDDRPNVVFNNEYVNNFGYGLTLNMGYNTFNLHFYYALTPLFSDLPQGSDPGMDNLEAFYSGFDVLYAITNIGISTIARSIR